MEAAQESIMKSITEWLDSNALIPVKFQVYILA